MGKRSRMMRSSSMGAASPLDKIFCLEPADAWEVKSAPTPTPPPAPAASPPPRVEMDLEVLPPVAKTRSAPPRGPTSTEARKEAPEGCRVSLGHKPVIFSVEASGRGPSTGDFVSEKPGELFGSCFVCKKVMEAKEPIYMFGYMRAFCSSVCRAKQMKQEGVVLMTKTKASEVNPTHVNKKSDSTRSHWIGPHGKGAAF